MKAVSDNVRKIIHIDMDAFFASVEQRDHPELRGKPVAVGGTSQRGVVAAASYEARTYGVKSAMPVRTALRKCGHLILVRPRFEVYKQVSMQIRDIFADYTDLIEPLSLDEAFLDVTFNKKQLPSASVIAKEIKQRIKDELNLTASAGVSINKFVAKIASDYQKPDGLYVVTPKKVADFVASLPVERFFGIGAVTARKMKSRGILTGADLLPYDMAQLVKMFGKAGSVFYYMARGIDNRSVNPDRQRKSVGVEETFAEDMQTRDEMLTELEILQKQLIRRIEKANFRGKTLTLKIKFSDFKQITRSKTFSAPLAPQDIELRIVEDLLQDTDIKDKKIRLLGLSVSNTEGDMGGGYQLTFDF